MQKQFHPHVSGLLCRLANRVGSRYYPARAGRWTRPVRKKDDRDGRRRADDAARGKRLMRPERLARGLALLTLCLASMGCEGIVDHLKANFAAKQGNDLYKAQDYQKAVEWYRYSLYLNPELPIAYHNAGLAFMALYKPGSHHPKDLYYAQQAIDHLGRFLSYEPDNEEAKNQLLTVFLQAERFDDAAKFFEGEMKERGSDPEVASRLAQILGMIYAKKGDFDSSLEWYKKRAEIQKDNPEALYTIGVKRLRIVFLDLCPLFVPLERRIEVSLLGVDHPQDLRQAGCHLRVAAALLHLPLEELGRVVEALRLQEDGQKLVLGLLVVGLVAEESPQVIDRLLRVVQILGVVRSGLVEGHEGQPGVVVGDGQLRIEIQGIAVPLDRLLIVLRLVEVVSLLGREVGLQVINDALAAHAGQTQRQEGESPAQAFRSHQSFPSCGVIGPPPPVPIVFFADGPCPPTGPGGIVSRSYPICPATQEPAHVRVELLLHPPRSLRARAAGSKKSRRPRSRAAVRTLFTGRKGALFVRPP